MAASAYDAHQVLGACVHAYENFTLGRNLGSSTVRGYLKNFNCFCNALVEDCYTETDIIFATQDGYSRRSLLQLLHYYTDCIPGKQLP